MSKKPPEPGARSNAKPKSRETKRALRQELERVRATVSRQAVEVSVGAARQAATFRGMLLYIQHPGLTIRQVYDNYRLTDEDGSQPLAELISWSAFHKRAVDARWAQKREEHWEGVERRVLAHLQTDHVQSELEEMSTLAAAEARLNLYIHGGTEDDGTKIDPVKPKSLEGTVKALLELDKLRSIKRQRVVDATAAAAALEEKETGPAGAGNGVIVEDTFDDAEIEELADRIARRRAGVLEDKSADQSGEE